MILNLHGLNGSAHNTNYKLLLKMYSEDMIVSPQIDYAITSPIKILERLKGYKNVSYIVGNSFGGFYTYILSNMCNTPCLLVNPCIPPDRYIPSLVEGYAYTSELINLMDEYSLHPQPVYMILGMDDTVLSSAYTEQLLDITELWEISGGHSLSGNQHFYSVFSKAIEKLKLNGNNSHGQSLRNVA